MITPKKKVAVLLLFTCISFCSLAQETIEKIWVTFETSNDVPDLIKGKLLSTNSSVQTLIEEFNVVNVEQAVPASSKESLIKVYEVTCNCDADAFSKAITNRSKELTNPELAPEYQLLDTPDDYTTSFQVDYALDLINAEGAWEYSIGDESTIIGISDANYFETHEELEGKIDYLDPQNGSGNYYHGTAVAITAAGHTNNGVGKSAIGYNCKLNLSANDYNKVLQMSHDGIRVINLSWASGCTPNTYVQSIIDEVYENGTILVAAAGNGSTCGGPTNPVFPAACDHVISVTSIGENDNHERVNGDPNSSHQHHSTVDICAPGYDIALSMAPGNYQHGSGTSFAAPLVSGTIGLMLSLKSCLTYEEIVEILRLSSDDIYTLNPSYVGLLGSGRLNAERALQLTEMNQCDGIIIYTPSVDTLTNDSTIVITITDNGTDPKPTIVSVGHQVVQNPVSTSSTAGVEGIAVIEVRMFPNPTTGSVTVKLEVIESMKLTVVDVRGVIVDQQELRSGMDETQINVEDGGVYFVQITKDDELIWFGKLIKS